ncbi:MAG: site-specific integrase, partial [Defluviitaleaceae bacterium]|nr:site-specific integrase [Defluviitaleaceae bacterium]
MSPFISKFINHMSAAKGAGENTLLAYRRDLCALEAYLAEVSPKGIEAATSTALMAYVLRLHKSGKHASTVSRCIAVIKNFYKYLYYERDITSDPALLLRSPKFSRTPPATLSGADRDKLLDSAPTPNSTAKDIRNHAITSVLSFTPIRIGIITELNLCDVDGIAGTITYRNARDTHAADLDPHLREPLMAYIHHARPKILAAANAPHDDPDAPLFVSMAGRRLTRQGLWKIVKEYGRHALPDLDLSP